MAVPPSNSAKDKNLFLPPPATSAESTFLAVGTAPAAPDEPAAPPPPTTKLDIAQASATLKLLEAKAFDNALLPQEELHQPLQAQEATLAPLAQQYRWLESQIQQLRQALPEAGPLERHRITQNIHKRLDQQLDLKDQMAAHSGPLAELRTQSGDYSENARNIRLAERANINFLLQESDKIYSSSASERNIGKLAIAALEDQARRDYEDFEGNNGVTEVRDLGIRSQDTFWQLWIKTQEPKYLFNASHISHYLGDYAAALKGFEKYSKLPNLSAKDRQEAQAVLLSIAQSQAAAEKGFNPKVFKTLEASYRNNPKGHLDVLLDAARYAFKHNQNADADRLLREYRDKAVKDPAEAGSERFGEAQKMRDSVNIRMGVLKK